MLEELRWSMKTRAIMLQQRCCHVRGDHGAEGALQKSLKATGLNCSLKIY